jgi:O-antigen ligase/polysaccharide polymerase Wzy-like membrane protein
MAEGARRYRLTWLVETLRRSPALATGAIGLSATLALAADEGGYEASSWYPAALFLLGLLAVTLIVRPGSGRPPPAAMAAAGLLLAYAVWSYLSISWADDQGVAVDGAGRALLYAVTFALFALWALDGRAGLMLVGLLGLGIAGIGLVELLKLGTAEDPGAFFIDKRLAEPVGYHNGNVALWFTGFWPCAMLAARREVPALLRGLALGGTGLLVGLALMGQSRGWFFSVPLVLCFFVAVAPGRGRVIAVLLASALAGLAMAGPVLDVYGAIEAGEGLAGRVDSAAHAILLAAGTLTVIGFGAGLLDRRVSVPASVARATSRALVALAVLAVLTAGAVAIVTTGDPVDSISDAWSEFKRGELPAGGETRFTASLGSGRYDIWRVAWSRFEAEPLHGIGADNFQQDYLADGKTLELPRFPHSVELRVLSQTGLVGALLLLGALVAAAAAALGARRHDPGPGAAAVAAASTVCLYWLVHGSVDWFWELPGLGCAAFAMLGVAVGLAPRRAGRGVGPATKSPAASGRPMALTVVLAAAGAIAALAATLALALPWLAERRVSRAVEIYRASPAAAYEELSRAGSLNPLSSRAPLVAATIALELDDLARAREDFRRALERNPRDQYAHLELGLIAAQAGRRREALAHLSRAAQLSPRDATTRRVLTATRRGRTVNLHKVNARIRKRAKKVVQPG